MAATTVTELIGKDYEKWENRFLYFISSGTGSGKTTFALRKLMLYHLNLGHSILYLVPRTILGNQIEEDILRIQAEEFLTADYFSKVKVLTYQALENLLIQRVEEGRYISTPNVIICDECHYWLSDSTFNEKTKVSYDYIINSTSSLRVFLSATSENIKEYIMKSEKISEAKLEPERPVEDAIPSIPPVKQKHNLKVYIPNSNESLKSYTVPMDYSYVNVKYITKNEDVLEIINNSQDNEKSVVFVSSKKNGEAIKINLYKNGIDSDFITADNKNGEMSKEVEKLASSNTFKKKVLIATSVLDVGLNFLDADIANIIIATAESTELMQMLGRIRVIREFQAVSLYIYVRNVEYFQNLQQSIREKLHTIKFLEEYQTQNDFEKLLVDNANTHEAPIDFENFIYRDYRNNNKYAINTLTTYQYRYLFNLYDKIIREMMIDEDCFIKLQLEWLGLQDSFCISNFYSKEIQKNRIQELKETIEREIEKQVKDGSILRMKKTECEEILLKFRHLIRKIDAYATRSNQSVSVKTFNRICKLHDICYCVAQRTERVNGKRITIYYLLKSDDEMVENLKLDIQI